MTSPSIKLKSPSHFHLIWIKKSQLFSFNLNQKVSAIFIYLNQKVSAIFILSESKSLSHFHFIWIKKSSLLIIPYFLKNTLPYQFRRCNIGVWWWRTYLSQSQYITLCINFSHKMTVLHGSEPISLCLMVTTWTADVQLIVTTWTADVQLIINTWTTDIHLI